MSTQITLTELESKAILAINDSEYSSWLGAAVWSFTIADNSDIAKASVSGVVSSLVKKGLAQCVKIDKEETVSLTKLGIEVARENKLLGQYE
jgi:DNA-binding MarR family transcriptional regulator